MKIDVSSLKLELRCKRYKKSMIRAFQGRGHNRPSTLHMCIQWSQALYDGNSGRKLAIWWHSTTCMRQQRRVRYVAFALSFHVNLGYQNLQTCPVAFHSWDSAVRSQFWHTLGFENSHPKSLALSTQWNWAISLYLLPNDYEVQSATYLACCQIIPNWACVDLRVRVGA